MGTAACRLEVACQPGDDRRAPRGVEEIELAGELPIERVIIPHGDLILSEGAARVRAAVAEAGRR